MGPLRIGTNGRCFVAQDGMPLFWLGDTQWELFRCLSRADAAETMEIRKRQGFTVLQVMITGVGDGTAPNLDGEKPWIDDDPAVPNEAYFRNVDAVVELARRQGLFLVLGVFHQLQTNHITPANARAYAKWLAQRYREEPHLVWTMYPQAKLEYLPVLRALATGLQEGDNGYHLITVHPDPSPTSSSFIHDEDWLAFNMIQTCVTYEQIEPMVRADYARVPIKPTVMAEGGYEGMQFGRLQTALEIRKQAYWSHLAGGHHSYGHNGCWESPETWREWIGSLGAVHLGVYKKIVTACREWWNLLPDQSLLAGTEGSGLTLNTAARSANGDWVLAYVSSNTTVSIQMESLTAGNTVTATWIEPTTGAKTRIGRFANKGLQSFAVPADWQDAVLFLTTERSS